MALAFEDSANEVSATLCPFEYLRHPSSATFSGVSLQGHYSTPSRARCPLYRGRVQHHSNRCAEGLGRKISPELCSHDTGVACAEVSGEAKHVARSIESYHVAE